MRVRDLWKRLDELRHRGLGDAEVTFGAEPVGDLDVELRPRHGWTTPEVVALRASDSKASAPVAVCARCAHEDAPLRDEAGRATCSACAAGSFEEMVGRLCGLTDEVRRARESVLHAIGVDRSRWGDDRRSLDALLAVLLGDVEREKRRLRSCARQARAILEDA